MIIKISKKVGEDKSGHPDRYWYDSFFGKMREFKCVYYNVRTEYSPYCVFNGKNIDIEEGIEKFKEFNSMKHIPNEEATRLMKEHGMILYDYIQKAIPKQSEKTSTTLDRQDFSKISSFLNRHYDEYEILNKTSQGIRVEIDEVNEETDSFLKEISNHYNYEEV